jgi:hypothetical protein
MKSRLNLGTLSVLALLLLLGVPGLALAQGNGGDDGSGFSSQVRSNPQPLLIYTVFGSTSDGSGNQTARTLVVYNNGLAISSGNGTNGDGSGDGNSSFQSVQLGSDQVNQLVRDLRRAGAFRAGGRANQQDTGDAPMTTVTVFSKTDNSGISVARTFSFFTADDARGRVNDVVNNFMGSNFDDNGGNNGGTGGQ